MNAIKVCFGHTSPNFAIGLKAVTQRANLDTDTLEGNVEVQSWLAQAQDAKKVIVQYIQVCF